MPLSADFTINHPPQFFHLEHTQIETFLCINLYLNMATGHSVLFQIKIETCLLQIYVTTSIRPNTMLEGDHGNRI